MIIMTALVLPVFGLYAQVPPGSGTNPPPGSGINPPPGSGQTTGPITITNPFKQNTIRGLIETIVNEILLPVGSVVAAVMIIYAGFLYVTAAGDPGQIKKAHDALLWAVIGAAILLGAWVISKAIKETIDTLRST